MILEKAYYRDEWWEDLLEKVMGNFCIVIMFMWTEEFPNIVLLVQVYFHYKHWLFLQKCLAVSSLYLKHDALGYKFQRVSPNELLIKWLKA